MARGQSSLVGVVLLLAITVVSLGVLLSGVGVIVEESVSAAATDRVADGLANGVDARRVGEHETQFALGDGTVRQVNRTVRLLDEGETLTRVDVGGLVYSTDSRRLSAVGGGVVVDGHGSRFHTRPAVRTVGDTLTLGVTTLNASGPAAVAGPASLTLRVNVSHSRRQFDGGQYAVAVETASPAPWERLFDDLGATTSRTDFDADGVPSVVAVVDQQTVFVTVHDLDLEVQS